MTQHIGPGESRTSGPSDTALGYIGGLHLELFKLQEVHREIYKTIWLGQNPEGIVYLRFNLQTSPQ